MTDLRELYQDIVLDHGRHPRNFKQPACYSHDAHGDNPLCGDQITLYLTVENGAIEQIHFQGRGCAISTASASLMTEVQCGKTLEQAKALFLEFQRRVMGEESSVPAGLEEEIERLEPLTGVRAYPARVKCAMLPWHTLLAALEGRKE